MLPITTQDPRRPELRNVLGDFLATDVINIVDGYFAHSDATEVLVLGTDGKPVDSELNRTTRDAIKLALTSRACDREVIRLIFQQAADHGYTGYLDGVMNELRDQKKAIILDNVDFSGINLDVLNFDEASLVNANFAGAHLDSVRFIGADLTAVRGLASATGYMRINHCTVLHNTELAYFQEKMTLARFYKPCLIRLLDRPEQCDKLFLSDLHTLIFAYSTIVKVTRTADYTRDSYQIIGSVTDDPTR